MSDEIKYTLNVQSVDNPLTKEVGDRRFVLVSNGTADFDRVISEIMAVNPGLERETVEAVVKLEHRTIMRLTLSGMRVSNGLFSAVASPKGRAGASWDPEVNQLNITIAQGADWREAIRNTTVNVLGDKAEVMYISGTTDIATRATDRTATPGYPFTVEGNYLARWRRPCSGHHHRQRGGHRDARGIRHGGGERAEEAGVRAALRSGRRHLHAAHRHPVWRQQQ